MNEKDKKIYCFFLLFSCFSESNGRSIKEPEAQFFRVDQTDNEFSDIEHVALSLSPFIISSIWIDSNNRAHSLRLGDNRIQ